MKNSFGEILKSVLKEKNITVYKLSTMTSVSKGHLYKIIKNEFEPSYYILTEISKALKIDVGEYYKISRKFECLEEYEAFIYLRSLIEHNKTIDEIETAIKNINTDSINDGIYKELICYIKALVSAKKYSRYEKSLEFCFLSLNINSRLFRCDNIENYIKSEVSFNTLSLIQYNYALIGENEKAKNISYSLIKVIEKMYFNNNIPNISIPNMVFRTYIAMLNNYADLIFLDKQYEKVIELCEKGITISKTKNSFYSLAYLYDNMLQAYYELGHFESATKCYDKASAVCFLNEDNEHLERINKRVKEKYIKIWR